MSICFLFCLLNKKLVSLALNCEEGEAAETNCVASQDSTTNKNDFVLFQSGLYRLVSLKWGSVEMLLANSILPVVASI